MLMALIATLLMFILSSVPYAQAPQPFDPQRIKDIHFSTGAPAERLVDDIFAKDSDFAFAAQQFARQGLHIIPDQITDFSFRLATIPSRYQFFIVPYGTPEAVTHMIMYAQGPQTKRVLLAQIEMPAEVVNAQEVKEGTLVPSGEELKRMLRCIVQDCVRATPTCRLNYVCYATWCLPSFLTCYLSVLFP